MNSKNKNNDSLIIWPLYYTNKVVDSYQKLHIQDLNIGLWSYYQDEKFLNTTIIFCTFIES